MNRQYETLFYLLTTFFFIFSVIQNIIFWTDLWQQKNFNVKRVILTLTQTKKGRTAWMGWENFLKWLLVVYYFSTIFYSSLLDYFLYFVFTVYFLIAVVFIWKLVNRNISLPVITPKIIFLSGITILITTLLYFIPLLDKYLWLFFLDKFSTVILGVGIFFLLVFSDLAQDVNINKAIKKRTQFPDLISIGIAGSYGKSEIKEFLYSVLSQSFNVLKTKPHNYSPDQIAERVLRNLNGKKQIFIADMNPYQQGQVTLASQIIQPNIGIVSAVNEHYFALFGSEKKIIEANYELIESLPRNGLALFDVSNKAMFSLFRMTRKKKISYANDQSPYKTVNIRGAEIELRRFAVTFSVFQKDKKVGRFSVQLLGTHVVESLLPVIYLSIHLGMSISDIRKALIKLRPLSHIMQPFRSDKKIILIDDTYHSNPATIHDAVEYLRVQKGLKVFVLQPMVELGRKAKPDHIKVAQMIASVCDYLIVTNDNYFEHIKNGVESAQTLCQLLKLSPRKTASFIEHNLHAGDFVVFEGKEAYSSFQLISKEPVLSA